jgi:predicted ABC-type ATPase
MKHLFLLRGLPGAGKSTVAQLIGAKGADYAHFEADMYFMQDGVYNFDPTKLKLAHNWCAIQTQKAMVDDTSIIIVSNTFTQEWEMETYYKLAKENGYKVFSLIVENRHGGVNEHGVPQEALDRMKARFETKLI